MTSKRAERRKRKAEQQAILLQQLTERVGEMENKLHELQEINALLQDVKGGSNGDFGMSQRGVSSRKDTHQMTANELKCFILSGQA